MPTPSFADSTWWEVFSRFLGRHGFGTVVAIYLIYNMVTNTNAKTELIAAQLKDLNGQLMHVSQAVLSHSDESKDAASETVRILRAICVNATDNPQERRDCVQ